ncbi:MAG TPA: hypothetical protein DCQ06_08415 [Myxococcales bacterium]|nr:hypothetical protein [Myxococcales bacterium]
MDKNIWKVIGPGLLFAGAAIGVSHLVQSTRAGALYGLGLVGVVLVANISKYPGLSFGSRYTNATGLSLLEAYRRQGVWTLWLFAALTCGSMFTVVAAVTLVTAAVLNTLVLQPLFPSISLQAGALVLFALVALLMRTGGFRWLDGAIKGLLGTMAALTFFATCMALPQVDWSSLSLTLPAGATEVGQVGFIIALAGWMPAPMDISVWNSMWALAKRDATGHRPTPKETGFDFNLGFGLCVVLALCFVVLGTVGMHQRGVAPVQGGVGFAKQILGLFTGVLGSWSYPVVGVAALAVMLSTTLTVLDAFSRVIVILHARLRGAEQSGEVSRDLAQESGYWWAFAILVVGATALLYLFLKSLGQLVDTATTLSFVTTPALAWFNHRAMFSQEVPEDYRPGKAMYAMSLVCCISLAAFALYYLMTRFG